MLSQSEREQNADLPLEQKPSVWARSNKGVHSRSTRDIELEEISKVTVDTARAILEKKSQIYDKLRRGKSGGLTEKQYDALLVDVCPRTTSCINYRNSSKHSLIKVVCRMSMSRAVMM